MIKKGFTILQTIIIITIGMVLLHFAIFFAQNMVKKSKIAVLKYNLYSIRKALEEFAKDHGYYPSRLSELTMEVSGGYKYLNTIPIDPTTNIDDWEILKESSFKKNNSIGNNLVVYYPFKRGSGTIAYDYGELPADDGTLRNGATWVQAYYGLGIKFDGIDDYIYLDDPSTNANPTFDNFISIRSVAVWFYYNGNDITSSQPKFIYEEGGYINGLNIYIRNGRIYVGAWSENDGWNGIWLSTPTTAFDWHHVVFVFDGPNYTFKLYYDGNLITTNPTGSNRIYRHTGNDSIATMVDSSKIDTGDVFGGPTYFFNGIIDEFRVYDYALNDNEVRELYETLATYWYERNEDIQTTGEILDIRSNNPLYQDY